MIRALERTFDIYCDAHQNPINQWLHAIGVPTIILGLFVAASAFPPLYIPLGVLALAYAVLGGLRGVFAALLFVGYFVLITTYEDLSWLGFVICIHVFGHVLMCMCCTRVCVRYTLTQKCVLIGVLGSVFFANCLVVITTYHPWWSALFLFVCGWIHIWSGHFFFEEGEGCRPASTRSDGWAHILLAPLMLWELVLEAKADITEKPSARTVKRMIARRFKEHPPTYQGMSAQDIEKILSALYEEK